MNARLALRNLARNRWRSALTAGGIAVAVALLIWSDGMTEAFVIQMAQSATAAELGDAQIHRRDYVDDPGLFHAFATDAVDLEAVRARADIEDATLRVQAFGLVGHEKHSQIGRIIGVDPEHEARVTRIARGVRVGRWLANAPAAPGPREAVLGDNLARQLGVEPGAELVVFLQGADGSLGNDLLEVVGIVRTGSSGLDRMAIYMHLVDAQYLTALDGQAHEIAIKVTRGADAELAASAIGDLIADAEPALISRAWTAIVPELHQVVELSRGSMWVMYLVLYLLAGLGILNAQRMSALERRREFGVLLAIGVTPGRMATVVVLETVFLTAIGGLVGAGLGAGVTAYHAAYGLDMGAFASTGDGSFTYMGAVFDPRLYLLLSPTMVVWPLVVLIGVGVVCGLWPAIQSARLDAVRAIAGRT